GLGLDPDLAVEPPDVGPHDVHADPATGGGRDLVGRAEAGTKDQLQHLALRKGGGRPGVEGALHDGPTTHAGGVDDAAVVGDFHTHDCASMAGREAHAGGG